MLLAYLCSLDEGIKKHRPEALKSMKIELLSRASKSIRKAASKRYCFRGGLRTSILSKICDFLMIFGFENWTKKEENHLKFHVGKKLRFEDDFWSKFRRFGLQKWSRNRFFSHLDWKREFWKNHCFSKKNLGFYWKNLGLSKQNVGFSLEKTTFF